jgi:CBS domain-containing protein
MVQESIWKEKDVMSVEKILPAARERLITIRDNAPLLEAAKLLGDGQINLVVVCNDGGAMVGVVTKTDIVRRISSCHGSGCATAVATVMTRDVTSCRPDDLLQNIWSIMKERSLLHIPIVGQDFKPLGVISARDALFELLGEVEHEESLLRDYVMGIGYR